MYKDFSKYDRIVMTLPEMLDLLKWRDNHKDYIRNYKQVLTEGIVEVKGSYLTYFKFLDDTYTLYEAWIDEHTRLLRMKTEWSNGYYRTVEKDINLELFAVMLQAFMKVGDTYSEVDLIADTATLVISCMSYMEHFNEEVHESKEITRKNEVLNNKHKKKRKDLRRSNVVHLKSVFKFSGISDKINLNVHDKKSFERHTFAWGVRGHQRHLASGKTIWIKPYEKGIEKEKKSPKVYKIN